MIHGFNGFETNSETMSQTFRRDIDGFSFPGNSVMLFQIQFGENQGGLLINRENNSASINHPDLNNPIELTGADIIQLDDSNGKPDRFVLTGQLGNTRINVVAHISRDTLLITLS